MQIRKVDYKKNHKIRQIELFLKNLVENKPFLCPIFIILSKNLLASGFKVSPNFLFAATKLQKMSSLRLQKNVAA